MFNGMYFNCDGTVKHLTEMNENEIRHHIYLYNIYLKMPNPTTNKGRWLIDGYRTVLNRLNAELEMRG